MSEKKHPLWVLVGGGIVPKESTERDEKDYIPSNATWIKNAVIEFNLQENCLLTKGGQKIR